MDVRLYRSEARPLMGILTMSDPKRKFRGNHKNFADIVKAGRARGAEVYVVTMDDLSLHESRIKAYAYREDKGDWVPRWIPLPRVLYNRIPKREDEQIPHVREMLRECMRNSRVKLFNPSFFNKWIMKRWLCRSPKTKKMIPITKRYTASTRMLPLLRKYGFLYLKPEHGKAGKGILRVQRTGGSKPYTLYAQDMRQTTSESFATLKEMTSSIRKRTEGENYIIQQGIDLCSSKGRPYDLRLLLQKNRKGNWAVTGVGARVAGESSITTHVPQGGRIGEPVRLLSASFGPARGKNIYQRVRLSGLNIAKQIEKASGRSHGEMSMDLGVDKRGNIWFFEANAKPMKFDEPAIRELSLRRLIDYAAFLANSKRNGSA
ncbi:YheC/YheD family protein [Xylanibacillus composti]|uniref:Endospore coat-associated protein YheD n=1 Tax=Xylanibacillus composti TaxID=1572762 RepID=A0A8J4H2P2_9BACL|nr:YheC/YheD family protein [Xylanibacillus composti]MDT9724775.1 YheC/YheD family protein [Xylanibacillus composti]GIQ69872.1 endospore coat-associated protein YheD [Xylanibacillus composti]